MNNPKRGFTLIEILFVLILMGVVAGIAVPNFSKTYANLMLKQTADHVAYLMRYARAQAIIRQGNLELHFNAARSEYWLEQRNTEGENVPLKGRYGKRFDIPERIKLESEEDVIAFEPNGTIAKADIYVRNQSKSLMLTTKVQSGQVLIFEGDYEAPEI